jgi:hypothetical protein
VAAAISNRVTVNSAAVVAQVVLTHRAVALLTEMQLAHVWLVEAIIKIMVVVLPDETSAQRHRVKALAMNARAVLTTALPATAMLVPHRAVISHLGVTLLPVATSLPASPRLANLRSPSQPVAAKCSYRAMRKNASPRLIADL